MTFGQIFSGRMLLMRAQRHIVQAGVLRLEQDKFLFPIFRGPAEQQAFLLVERLLVELEREFDENRKRCRGLDWIAEIRDDESEQHLAYRANNELLVRAPGMARLLGRMAEHYSELLRASGLDPSSAPSLDQSLALLEELKKAGVFAP